MSDEKTSSNATIVVPVLHSETLQQSASDLTQRLCELFNDDYLSGISKSLQNIVMQSDIVIESTKSFSDMFSAYSEYLSDSVLNLDFNILLSSYTEAISGFSDVLKQVQAGYPKQSIAASQAATAFLNHSKSFLNPNTLEKIKKEISSKEKSASKFTWKDFISIAGFVLAVISFFFSQKPNPQIAETNQELHSANARLQEIHEDLQYLRNLCEAPDQTSVDLNKLINSISEIPDDSQLDDSLE